MGRGARKLRGPLLLMEYAKDVHLFGFLWHLKREEQLLSVWKRQRWEETVKRIGELEDRGGCKKEKKIMSILLHVYVHLNF